MTAGYDISASASSASSAATGATKFGPVTITNGVGGSTGGGGSMTTWLTVGALALAAYLLFRGRGK